MTAKVIGVVIFREEGEDYIEKRRVGGNSRAGRTSLGWMVVAQWLSGE